MRKVGKLENDVSVGEVALDIIRDLQTPIVGFSRRYSRRAGEVHTFFAIAVFDSCEKCADTAPPMVLTPLLKISSNG